ncbi:MAG: serine--tRNA ligase [Candidatus Pacebacteria bacterium]|nr:serine--tRNA ligase [Candidatus Paceibacterota bacterium]
MLDIKFIRENKDLVKEAVKLKGVNLDIDKLLDIDKEKNKFLQEIEKIRNDRNKNAHLIENLQKEKKDFKKYIKKGKEIKENLSKIEEKYKIISEEYKKLILLVPNIPAKDAPKGGEEANKEIYKSGDIPKFDFKIKDHIQIGKDLDLIDIEKGAKTSGFRGYYLKNKAVFLQFTILWYALKKVVEKGYQPFWPPALLREFALIGSGHFPEGKEDIYQIANPGKLESGQEVKEKIFLAGTSEPSLLTYFSDRVFKEEELPVKVCGISPCYRSEVGSYGKDTKGLYRVHEFMKVEEVVFCRNDTKESNKHLEEMRLISEEILKELNLPYRIVEIATGDMGVGKHKMYDIETWMPSRQSYGETHSASNLTDWQSRRLNIKYKEKKGDKKFVHALNNTVIASPRILISILECYQQKDGSVKIPKVLQKYLGFDTIK